MHKSISFQPLQAQDLALLRSWMNQPHWTEWWEPPGSLAELERKYLPRIDRPCDVRPFIAMVDGRPLGYCQSYVAMRAGDGWWAGETDPGVWGIDQSIGDAADLNRGLGTAMAIAFSALLFSRPEVTRIQVDPHPANLRAIRCYGKAGFVARGEVLTPEGRALLMVRDRPAAGGAR